MVLPGRVNYQSSKEILLLCGVLPITRSAAVKIKKHQENAGKLGKREALASFNGSSNEEHGGKQFNDIITCATRRARNV